MNDPLDQTHSLTRYLRGFQKGRDDMCEYNNH